MEPLPVEDPLRLYWNCSDLTLNPKEQIFVVLTLEMSSDPRFIDFIIDNDVKQFYFDINIKPIGQ
jgi:hypothetical protein